jgi:UDP-glucose 4-epimerase
METYETKFEDKNVLITGGLGFIGSNLAHELVKLKAKVTIVDSLIPEYGGNLFNIQDIKDNVDLHISDVRDKHAIRTLIQDKDFIFNLAGQVSHIDSMKDPFTDLDINCTSQLSLLEACRNSNKNVKIVYASTRQIYGKPEYLPIDETHILKPTDVNGINKMAGEWYHILYNNIYGIKACSLRLTNTFGPRQLMKHSRQGFIPWFIRQIIDGEEIKVFGTGEQLRDINYIDDVTNAFLVAASTNESNGRRFNLGHFNPVSLKGFVKELIEANGSGNYSMVPFPDEKKKIDVGSTYCSYRKINKILGWEPKVEIKEGLRKTIEFYRQHKSHYW